MSSLFEKIAQRELPGHIVREDETFIAFLTIGPLADGHTLVIPKKNRWDYIFDLDSDQYTALLQASKKVASILQQKLQPDRISMSVEWLEVPHVHVHLIPLYDGAWLADLTQKEAIQEELIQISRKIRWEV